LAMFAGASLYGCAAVWAVDRLRRRGAGPVARVQGLE
jgi:hypothetical protein